MDGYRVMPLERTTLAPRLRVLAVAYACAPEEGSEAGVGWQWVRMLRDAHEICVITAEHNRCAIERYTASQGAPAAVRFVYVPRKWWHYAPTRFWRAIENSMLKPIMNLAYSGWQRDAVRVAKVLSTEMDFDLVHLVTYVGFRFPGRFDQLGLPFVWGPIGGLENTPWRFLPMMGLGGCFYYAGRNVINTLQKWLLPGPRRALGKAAQTGGIIAATQGIRAEIHRWYGQPSQVICEVGPPAQIAHQHSIRREGEPLKLAWSGLHLPGKALPLLLGALARLPRPLSWELTILGQGPCTKRWRKLAAELGLADRCRWMGWVRRDHAVERIHQAHIFVITSIKDLTSTVLLEALAQGVPVICPNMCGFADVVTDECGIRLDVVSPRQVETDLAAAIVRFAEDEPLRRQSACGALLRVQAFSWDNKARTVEAIYRAAISATDETVPRSQTWAVEETTAESS